MENGGDDCELSMRETVGENRDVVESLQRLGRFTVIEKIEGVRDAESDIGRLGGACRGSFRQIRFPSLEQSAVTRVVLNRSALRRCGLREFESGTEQGSFSTPAETVACHAEDVIGQ